MDFSGALRDTIYSSAPRSFPDVKYVRPEDFLDHFDCLKEDLICRLIMPEFGERVDEQPCLFGLIKLLRQSRNVHQFQPVKNMTRKWMKKSVLNLGVEEEYRLEIDSLMNAVKTAPYPTIFVKIIPWLSAIPRNLFSDRSPLIDCILDKMSSSDQKDVLFIQDSNGRSALHHACIAGNRKVFRALYQQSPTTLSIPDSQGMTPFLWAVYKGHCRLVRLIFSLDSNARFHQNDLSKDHVLHLFSASTNQKLIRYLIYQCKNLLEKTNLTGETPLISAVKSGNKMALKSLFKAKADPFVFDLSGKQCIHWAAILGRLECIIYLVKHVPLLLNSKNSQNQATVLHYAALMGHDHIVQWIILRKNLSDLVKSRDICLRSALHWAAVSNSDICFKILMRSEIDLNAADIDGVTVLHNLVALGAEGLVELLLANHFGNKETSLCIVDIDVPDAAGRSPLAWAVMRQNLACSKLLLKAGAMVNAIDDRGNTPLHYATFALIESKAFKNVELIQLLLDKGARTTAINLNGQTPADYVQLLSDTSDLFILLNSPSK